MTGTAFISLSEAAVLLRYKSTSTLRKAAIDGTLPSVRAGERAWITTKEDALAWDAGRRHGEGYARGGEREGVRGPRRRPSPQEPDHAEEE